ncbi:MAG: SRPBCC domain-containing protein [Flavobacteriales bacterium]|nr:SRPBCC domain-containing protein [Flavobacteriales bacterium]MBP9080018.1 SRPBCC domain-containing protein [Flavobacteriales bacterium]
MRTTRTISAPRERVFAAWTEQAELARWWGPHGFTNSIHRFELKPEGYGNSPCMRRTAKTSTIPACSSGSSLPAIWSSTI